MKVHESLLGSGAVSQEAARKMHREDLERQEFEEDRMIRLPVRTTILSGLCVYLPTLCLRLSCAIIITFLTSLPCHACRTQRSGKKKEGQQKGHLYALILLLTLEMLET